MPRKTRAEAPQQMLCQIHDTLCLQAGVDYCQQCRDEKIGDGKCCTLKLFSGNMTIREEVIEILTAEKIQTYVTNVYGFDPFEDIKGSLSDTTSLVATTQTYTQPHKAVEDKASLLPRDAALQILQCQAPVPISEMHEYLLKSKDGSCSASADLEVVFSNFSLQKDEGDESALARMWDILMEQAWFSADVYDEPVEAFDCPPEARLLKTWCYIYFRILYVDNCDRTKSIKDIKDLISAAMSNSDGQFRPAYLEVIKSVSNDPPNDLFNFQNMEDLTLGEWLRVKRRRHHFNKQETDENAFVRIWDDMIVSKRVSHDLTVVPSGLNERQRKIWSCIYHRLQWTPVTLALAKGHESMDDIISTALQGNEWHFRPAYVSILEKLSCDKAKLKFLATENMVVGRLRRIEKKNVELEVQLDETAKFDTQSMREDRCYELDVSVMDYLMLVMDWSSSADYVGRLK